MIELTMKKWFLDTPKVIRLIGKAATFHLARAAGLIRTIDIRSMRRKKGPSAPGDPPHAHAGLIKRVLFAYDPTLPGMVIGTVKLPIKGDVPHVLEFGGNATVRKFRRRDGKNVLVNKVITIAPRPHTGPALLAAMPKIPQIFDGMLNKGSVR